VGNITWDVTRPCNLDIKAEVYNLRHFGEALLFWLPTSTSTMQYVPFGFGRVKEYNGVRWKVMHRPPVL